MLTVRRPVERDAEEIGRVHVLAWQAAYRGVMPDEYLDGLDAHQRAEMWRRQITSSGGQGLLVASLDERVVGFVAFGESRDDAGLGEIHAMNVDPSVWGRGSGRRLLRDATAELESAG